jgi:hypothetical protein
LPQWLLDVAQERKPAFRRLGISRRRFAHPAGDGSLGNVEAEHDKFTMNPRRSPGRISATIRKIKSRISFEIRLLPARPGNLEIKRQ